MHTGLRALMAAGMGVGILLGASTASYAEVKPAASAVEIMPGMDVVSPKATPIRAHATAWSFYEYVAAWEKANGHVLEDYERAILEEGPSGVVALNIGRNEYNPTLDLSFELFETAQNVARKLNQILAKSKYDYDKFSKKVRKSKNLKGVKNIEEMFPRDEPGEWTAEIFSMRFFSQQHAMPYDLHNGDPDAFRPDPKTGQVDMSSYNYLPRRAEYGITYRNCAYAWYDPATDNWWSADRPHRPEYGSGHEMKIYQSTLEHFSRQRADFDRQVFVVTFAKKRGPHS